MKKNTAAVFNPITEGPIVRAIMFFFIPILVGTFFQQLYNTVDTIIVGRFLGTEAIASVGGSSGQITNLVVGFFTALSAGACVVIAQFYGAENYPSLKGAIHTAYAFSIIGGLAFIVIGVLFSRQMLVAMNNPEELMQDSTLYLQIYFAGIIFVFLYNTGSAILRALGDSKSPLYYLIICCLLNIVLDLFTVVVLHMGVAGVAVSTVIAQGVSAGLVSWKLMQEPDAYRLKWSDMKLTGQFLKKELYLGVPSGIQSLSYSVSNIILQSAINLHGTNAAAAWTTTGKVDGLFWMVNGAYGSAIITFAGQNFGAGNLKRVKKGTGISLLLHQISAILIVLLILVFRLPLLHIFTEDGEVIAIASDIIVMIVPFYPIFSYVEIFSGTLRAGNHVLIPALISILGICGVRILWLLFYVPRHSSLMAILVCYPITWCLAAVLFIFYYLYMRKRDFRV